ncbi:MULTISPECIES: DUF1360 domain-containing protein [unclassified Niallia]|uniref:DUF1360 domain-containing protein n=1 Tax=Niallia TaxID=2837506 RepID=UPI001EDBE545|nr:MULTISPECIES: DUF1360 domain-containing protein [unclassified Niallia]MCM3030519.1 DUF1360 domain-containing protein [Niallia sp. MER 6]MDL0434557.1 DUF1360 domain-containing protein [Niallia sp. SS-2023]UPO88475.1 DUF1360 domain-containing protein [Niallia sp. Man26]
MNIEWIELLLLVLATFRLTRLLVFDRITEFLRMLVLDEKLEKNENGEDEIYYVPKDGLVRGFLGELISCYWCTGVWSTGFLVLLYYFLPSICTPVVLILAIAGAASIIEAIVQKLTE